MERPTVLVVDDDEDIRHHLSALLPGLGYEVSLVPSGEAAMSRLGSGLSPALMMLDLMMPGVGGLDVLERVRQSYPQLPVVILSAVGQARTVVEAMNRGASDYLTKPFEPEELRLTLENVLEKQRLRNEVRQLRSRLEESEPTEFLSSSPRMLRLKEMALQVAESDATVLILGETGVGKEIMTRFLHARSPRRDRPLVKVNCAALPHDLLESELFGYERGAFSGAVRDKPGMFELAHRGSILLDEIAEMSSQLQAKLLHVLQDGAFSRLGGRQPVRVDARIFASTNQRLEEAVADGAFREDLYFRLNVIRIEIPPLRERREDIPLLASEFLRRNLLRLNRPLDELPPPLFEAFMRHDWPGNVRELENAVRRFVILPDIELALAELRRTRSGPGAPPTPAQAPADASLKAIASRAADSAERDLVLRVLNETRWNRSEAARRLKISYKTLLTKLKKWRLEDDRATQAAGDAAAKAH